MVSKYKGHTITCTRERSMGGDMYLYFSIIRDSDGYICEDNFSDSNDTIRDMIKCLKERVDNELAEDDPWEEAAGF